MKKDKKKQVTSDYRLALNPCERPWTTTTAPVPIVAEAYRVIESGGIRGGNRAEG